MEVDISMKIFPNRLNYVIEWDFMPIGLVHTFWEKIANKRKLNERIVSYVRFVVSCKYTAIHF